jgi:hypothetical protein
MIEAIEKLYEHTEVAAPRFYGTAEEAIAAEFNGDTVAALQACLDEKVLQGIEIENHWLGVEKSRPLTAAENDIARESLINVRRDLAAYHRAFVGLKRFEALPVSSASVN